MNPHDIPVAGPVELFLWNAMEWLDPIVHAIGLAVAVWAFRCCRKWGYLVVGLYFVLALFSLLTMPSINRAIREHRAPDISEQTQQINAAVQQATDRALEEEEHPIVVAKRTVHLPFGPIVLVVGLWLIARATSTNIGLARRCNEPRPRLSVRRLYEIC